MNNTVYKGKTYKIGKINAFEQLRIVKRLAPLMGKLQEMSEIDFKGDQARGLAALGEAIAEIPDADAEYIINACLGAVELRQDAGSPGGVGNWARVRVNGALMFPLELEEMLFLTFQVVRANLSTFFFALGSLSPAGQTMTASSM